MTIQLKPGKWSTFDDALVTISNGNSNKHAFGVDYPWQGYEGDYNILYWSDDGLCYGSGNRRFDLVKFHSELPSPDPVQEEGITTFLTTIAGEMFKWQSISFLGRYEVDKWTGVILDGCPAEFELTESEHTRLRDLLASE